MKIRHITLLVKGFDEALKFYVEKLGFQKRDKTKSFGKICGGLLFRPKTNLS